MSKNDKFKVDFIGVGFPKCGTEWISACLREHPEIDFSRHKETNYFMTTQTKLGDYVCKHVKARDFSEYQNEFENDGRVKGEFSVHYAYDKEAIKGIKKKFPNTKIIIALRDPVKFLHSAYWFLKYSNAFHDLPDTFEEAVYDAKEKYICRKEYAEFSRYVIECFKHFDKANILVVLTDDIKNSPEDLASNIYKFLDVDPNYVPKCLHERINETQEIRSSILMSITSLFVKIIMKINMGKILYDVINTENPIRTMHRKFVRKSCKYPELDLKFENKLRKEFLDEIELLEKIINRDLSNWK